LRFFSWVRLDTPKRQRAATAESPTETPQSVLASQAR
jgi:hypothetical protein